MWQFGWVFIAARPQRPRRRFNDLSSAQQAAVLHGLKMEPTTYNDFVRPAPPKAKELVLAPRPLDALGGALLGGAWSLAQRYGPALGSVLKEARHPVAQAAAQALQMLPFWLDLREGAVEVTELETAPSTPIRIRNPRRFRGRLASFEVLYLDDSASMRGPNLTEAQGALRKMAHLLQRRVRVCTFGLSKQVILPRRPTDATLGV